MASSIPTLHPTSTNKLNRHLSSGSIDTTASGIAESTISLGLARFPEPPSSFPTPPLRSDSPSTASVGRRPLPQRPVHSPHSQTHIPLSTRSPHDWHDGASSIAVDPKDERLLPASLITTLLQEDRRASTTSDAQSGISEMTYPPANRALPRTQAVPPSAWQHPHIDYRASTVPSDVDSFVDAHAYIPALRTISSQGSIDTAAHSTSRLVVDHTRPPSVHSQKSYAPSFISRISSLRRKLTWRRAQPLPAVPRIDDISIAAENEHRRIDESAPLPDLVHRAGALEQMLEKGHRPQSLVSSKILPATASSYNPYEAEMWKYGSSTQNPPQSIYKPLSSKKSYSFRQTANQRFNLTRRKLLILIGVLVVVIAAAAGIGVGVASTKKTVAQFNCPGNFTGNFCNLDTTCTCTSGSRCNPLAMSVLAAIPPMNSQFNINITATYAYTSIWMLQGNPTTSNCAAQALLLDTGKDLDAQTYPKRAQWARGVLLWNVLQTQDVNTVEKLQTFVQKLPWKSLERQDTPINHADFSITIAGYVYDFAAQTAIQPTASFTVQGQPTEDQLSRVNGDARAALDRIYTNGQASSLQRSTALQNYWASVLTQRPDDLTVFKTALGVTPIMLPFNASSSIIRGLYSSSSTTSFPPPPACMPNLNAALRDQLSSVETSVYGLQPLPAQSRVDPSCFPSRPVYGVLNILRLRAPYVDANLAGQSAILKREALPRVAIYNGNAFTGGYNGSIPISPALLDPRQYGTLAFSDHIILQYLSSMDVRIASAVVKFVLNSVTKAAIPPDLASLVYQSLDKIPAFEVAVFGSITPADVESTTSTFMTPRGSFFFGSTEGAAFRNWAIATVAGPIVWAQNATSPLVVRDTTLDSTSTISRTFTSIADAIAGNTARRLGLTNITTAFTNTKDFSP